MKTAANSRRVLLYQALGGLLVIERRDDRLLGVLRQGPRRNGNGPHFIGGAYLVRRRANGDRQLVVPTVVASLELQDLLSSGIRPRQPHRVVKRVGPAAAVQGRLLRVRDNLGEGFAQRHLPRVRLREQHALGLHGVDHSAANSWLVISQARRAVGCVIVDILIVIDIPDSCAEGLFHEKGEGFVISSCALYARWRVSSRFFVQTA